MKIKTHQEHGAVLLVTLVVAALLGVVVAAQVALINRQNNFIMRSQAWASEIPIAEAGIEEALAHLNSQSAGLDANGWSLSGSEYVKTRAFTDGYCYVAISTASPPKIVSIGYAAVPGQVNYTHRTVLVKTTLSMSGGKGMIGRTGINLGNDFHIDSYDSTDPNYSTLGLFDPSKTKNGGDIAVLTNLAGALDVDNSEIYGHASTPPGGVIAIGNSGFVGEKAWRLAGNVGIESGWSSDDATMNLADVDTPAGAAGWAGPPGGQTLGGITYSYVLGSGDYNMGAATLKGSVYVSGNVNLYVPPEGRIQFGSGETIKILPGASLTIYNASSSDAVFMGVSNDTGTPKSFSYLGLPTVAGSRATFSGQFAGVVYAPSQKLVLSGGTSYGPGFLGRIVGDTITTSGHFYMHYDESLGKGTGGRAIVKAVSWEEL